MNTEKWKNTTWNMAQSCTDTDDVTLILIYNRSNTHTTAHSIHTNDPMNHVY